MNIEKKVFVPQDKGKNFTASIKLDKFAIPESVKVTFLGKEFIPVSFNSYGHPNFTEEQYMFSRFLEDEFHLKSKEFEKIYAHIEYEERIFDVPVDSFNTINSIKNAITSLSSLNDLVMNRKIFNMTSKKEKLKSFVIWGCILLDETGQTYFIKKRSKGVLHKKFLRREIDVESFYTFIAENYKYFEYELLECELPKENEICPYCGKLITIEDVKNIRYNYNGNKFYHDNCLKNYIRLNEIHKQTSILMYTTYGRKSFEYELLPDNYYNNILSPSATWILFHTNEGDILIGSYKNTFYLEWQKNYKPFSFQELFSSEEVKKFEIVGTRGIMALSLEKAANYLYTVLCHVNNTF